MTPDEAVAYALSKEENPAPTPRQPAVGTPPASLTRREREVVAVVARGLTNRRIAVDLGVSERTVETHVRNALKKLGLKSRFQLAERWQGGYPG